jgi:plastocyanin
MMWRLLGGVVLVGFLALCFGCGGGGGPVGGPPSGGQETVLRAILRGSQERPNPVTTNALGTATVRISADRSTIIVEWQTNGLQNVTAAHIHVGGLLDATPPAIGFFNPQQDNPDSGSKTLVKGQVSVGAGLTFDDVVNALLSGNAYINFHTQAHPAGEIRGQIGPVTLAAQLTGDQEAPNPVQTNATGSAIVQLNNTQDQITVLVRTTGLQNVTAAHIHVGAVGQAGPIIFPLDHNATTQTLTAANLQAQPAQGINTFDDAINALLSGNAYINFHTQAHLPGEIRGQIVPAARVTIRNFAFNPANLTVRAGAAVIFTNEDNVAHTATSDTNAFDTGLLSQGQFAVLWFRAAGNFPYHCTPHPNMQGTITVQ